MSEYKLTYFNFRGRAELCRYIFACAGVKYEDIRIAMEDWPKMKPNTLCGCLPELDHNGVKFSQSITIARYLANKFGMAGKTNADKARADMVVDITLDFLPTLVSIYKEQDTTKKDDIINKVTRETMPALFSTLEKLLKENHNGDGFFVGDEVTWADLQVSLMAAWPDTVGLQCDLSKYVKLNSLIQKVDNLPEIKEWIKTRPQTSR